MKKGYLCFKMGSCVSMDENPDSDMKLRFSFASKADKILIPLPTEEKSVKADHPFSELGFRSQSSLQNSTLTSYREFGSKEETFFDSQPWLDSDCESFYSVNGDFTSSRGNTPNHQSGFIVTPQLNKSLSIDGAADTRNEAFVTDKKKNLAELFLESFRANQDDNQTLADNLSISNEKLEPKPNNLDLPPRSNGSPYMCGLNAFCSSELTTSKDFKREKERSARAAQCCLPSFVQSRRLSDGKKRLNLETSGEDNKN